MPLFTTNITDIKKEFIGKIFVNKCIWIDQVQQKNKEIFINEPKNEEKWNKKEEKNEISLLK